MFMWYSCILKHVYFATENVKEMEDIAYVPYFITLLSVDNHISLPTAK